MPSLRVKVNQIIANVKLWDIYHFIAVLSSVFTYFKTLIVGISILCENNVNIDCEF